MGEHVRPVGAAREHGESLHQSVLDRMAHAPCDYRPANLPDPNAIGALPVCTTTRVPRGIAC